MNGVAKLFCHYSKHSRQVFQIHGEDFKFQKKLLRLHLRKELLSLTNGFPLGLAGGLQTGRLSV
jgi:hypothetical protein